MVLVASVVVHFVVLSTLRAVPRAAPISRLNAIDVTFRVIEMGPIATEAKHSRQSSKRMVQSYSMMDIARALPSAST